MVGVRAYSPWSCGWSPGSMPSRPVPVLQNPGFYPARSPSEQSKSRDRKGSLLLNIPPSGSLCWRPVKPRMLVCSLLFVALFTPVQARSQHVEECKQKAQLEIPESLSSLWLTLPTEGLLPIFGRMWLELHTPVLQERSGSGR